MAFVTTAIEERAGFVLLKVRATDDSGDWLGEETGVRLMAFVMTAIEERAGFVLLKVRATNDGGDWLGEETGDGGDWGK